VLAASRGQHALRPQELCAQSGGARATGCDAIRATSSPARSSSPIAMPLWMASGQACRTESWCAPRRSRPVRTVARARSNAGSSRPSASSRVAGRRRVHPAIVDIVGVPSSPTTPASPARRRRCSASAQFLIGALVAPLVGAGGHG
jgi:hypothetical protein